MRTDRAMTGLIFLLIASYLAVIHGDTFYSCSWITSDRVDCERFSSEVTCGTDGVTYKNKCYFSKAHCKDQTLNLQNYGNCTTGGSSSGSSSGSEVLQDVLCVYLMHQGCDKVSEPTCGSDGRTYPNYCEFEKAKCTHRNLHVANFGNCTV